MFFKILQHLFTSVCRVYHFSLLHRSSLCLYVTIFLTPLPHLSHLWFPHFWVALIFCCCDSSVFIRSILLLCHLLRRVPQLSSYSELPSSLTEQHPTAKTTDTSLFLSHFCFIIVSPESCSLKLVNGAKCKYLNKSCAFSQQVLSWSLFWS